MALGGLVFGALSWPPRGPSRRQVRVALVETSPFLETRVNGRPVGLTVELLEEAARRKDLQIQWIDARQSSSSGLQNGIVDVWPGIAQTPERLKRFHITRPYLRRDFCLVSLKSRPLLTPEECGGRKVALVNGPFAKALAARFLPEADRVTVQSRLHAITALCRGEVDATFTESSFFNGVMLARPPECGSLGLRMTPLRGPTIEEGLAARPENAALADGLRDGLESMRSDGTFMRLLAYHLPSAVSENEILLQEQRERYRMSWVLAALSVVTGLILVLMWQNRRVTRARRLTDQANSSLRTSMAQLGEAHERLSIQVGRMPLACIVSDAKYRVREWNPAAEAIFGWTGAEAKGRSLGDLLLPVGTDKEPAWEGCTTADSSHREQTLVAKDGRTIVCQWLGAPLRDDKGQTTEMLSLVQDVTSRTQMEEALRQTHKLESIGRLAGGVAHDFNNLLTVINGYADMTLMDLHPDASARAGIEEIRNAGRRAAELTSHLLAFSRKQFLRPTLLDLNAVVEVNAGIFARLLGENIQLEVRPAERLGFVMLDEGQLHRVMMNLLANARDAMPAGGTVTITTANIEAAPPSHSSNDNRAPGPAVEISVADAGIGMEPDTLEHIFEPFFTTKGRATATGLGLAMVHGVVRQSGGSIDVISSPGRGTTVRIRLPRVEPPAARSQPPCAAESLHRGTGRILVVEDQAGVRDLAASLLEKGGYQVLQASCGIDAIDIAKAESSIDLLLTDIIMPRMSGPDVAAAVRELHPNIGLLYMSGYSREGIGLPCDLPVGTPVLSKPFTRDELLSSVTRALASRTTS